jgi:PAS domain S-box-containing protein
MSGKPIDPREVVAAAADAIIVTNAQGEIVVWNPAATRIFGFDEAEAMGKSLDLIIPERLRKRHWDGYDVTMRTGVTKYGTELLKVPAVDKQGRTLSIAFTVALLHEGGSTSPTAIMAIIRDETARFAEERALRKRITELEAAQKLTASS